MSLHTESARRHIDRGRLAVTIEGISDSCRRRVSLVQDDAIGEPEFTAGMESVIAGLAQAEIVPTERVGGEQPIGSHVPCRGVSEAAGMSPARAERALSGEPEMPGSQLGRSGPNLSSRGGFSR